MKTLDTCKKTVVPPLPIFEYLPRELAAEIGIIEARILRFLARKIDRSRKVRDGRPYWYGSIRREFASRFPYWKVDRIASAIRRLERLGLIERKAHFNKLKQDRTSWYSVPAEVMRKVNHSLVAYALEDARRFDVESALILHSLTYHIGQSRITDPTCIQHHLSPTGLSRYLPIGVDTIKRRLKHLESEGVIRKVDGEESTYALLERLEERLVRLPDRQRAAPAEKTEEIASDAAPNRQCVAPQDVRAFLGKLEAARKEWLRGKDTTVEMMRSVYQARNALRSLSDEEIYDLRLSRRVDGHLLGKVADVISRPSFAEVRGCPVAIDALLALIGDQIRSDYAVHFPPGHFSHFRMELLHREEAGRKAWNSKYREKVKVEHASPDAKYENDAFATPNRKAEIVMAGINSLNKIGLTDDDDGTHCNKFPKGRDDERQLIDFFGAHPEWTPRMILNLVEKCGRVSLYPPDDGFDEMFFSRRGANVGFMIQHLVSVLRELEAGDEYTDGLNEAWVERVEGGNERRREAKRAAKEKEQGESEGS